MCICLFGIGGQPKVAPEAESTGGENLGQSSKKTVATTESANGTAANTKRDGTFCIDRKVSTSAPPGLFKIVEPGTSIIRDLEGSFL